MRLSKFIDFYINSSIHVAFAVVAFLKITALYLDLPIENALLFFAFFATITGYNFVKYAGVAKLHHKSLTNSLKIIQIFSFFSFLALCYFSLELNIKLLLYTIPFFVLTFLYAVPFFSGFEKNLREISYLKILVVALVWSGFTVIIPVVNADLPVDFNVTLLLFQRFLIVIVLILPFDIRDVKYDSISLQTIPKKVGEKQTKRIGLILMVVALFLEYFIEANVSSKNAFMLFFFITLLFLMRSSKDQSKYFSSFWVESLPIVWLFILLQFS